MTASDEKQPPDGGTALRKSSGAGRRRSVPLNVRVWNPAGASDRPGPHPGGGPACSQQARACVAIDEAAAYRCRVPEGPPAQFPRPPRDRRHVFAVCRLDGLCERSDPAEGSMLTRGSWTEEEASRQPSYSMRRLAIWSGATLPAFYESRTQCGSGHGSCRRNGASVACRLWIRRPRRVSPDRHPRLRDG